jgi:hypothetical protein
MNHEHTHVCAWQARWPARLVCSRPWCREVMLPGAPEMQVRFSRDCSPHFPWDIEAQGHGPGAPGHSVEPRGRASAMQAALVGNVSVLWLLALREY